MSELPEKYLPKFETNSMEVPVVTEPSPVTTDPEKAQEIARELGMVAINRQAIESIRQLGQLIEGVETVRVADGFVVATQQHVLIAIYKLSEKLNEGGVTKGEMQKIGQTIGYLSNSMAKCSQVLKSKQKPHIAQRDRAKGFEPGMVITGSNVLIQPAKENP